MDRNLGASRVATSLTDTDAYGDLYQWGRGTDGHEKRNSGITSILSSSDDPGHGSFITTDSSPYDDWRVPQNDNLWQGVNGINNPCPAGFRLPTATEWQNEIVSWASNNSEGAWDSPLKLVLAAGRIGYDGSIWDAGSRGRYSSSSLEGSLANSLNFTNGNAFMDTAAGRIDGLSVRCIQD
jgi:hypothetical protein